MLSKRGISPKLQLLMLILMSLKLSHLEHSHGIRMGCVGYVTVELRDRYVLPLGYSILKSDLSTPRTWNDCHILAKFSANTRNLRPKSHNMFQQTIKKLFDFYCHFGSRWHFAHPIGKNSFTIEPGRKRIRKGIWVKFNILGWILSSLNYVYLWECPLFTFVKCCIAIDERRQKLPQIWTFFRHFTRKLTEQMIRRIFSRCMRKKLLTSYLEHSLSFGLVLLLSSPSTHLTRAVGAACLSLTQINRRE